MDGILDVLLRGMDIVERLRNMSDISGIQMIVFGVILVFGIINCLLGYRLLRFWMMLFGFLIGSGLGFGASFLMGVGDGTTRLAVSAGLGILLAVIVFISYKAGIFVLGAGLGIGIAVYVLHPTTSLLFFICLLAGAGLGSLAMKWAREVIIVGTSLLGGAMAGMSLAKIAGYGEFPYGVGFSAAFAALGMLIQFATNRVKYEDDEEEEPVPQKIKYKEPEEAYIPRNRKKKETSSAEDYRVPVRDGRDRKPRKHVPVDLRIEEEDTYKDIPIESEKTIEFRPRRKKDPEFDLPLDSFVYNDYARTPRPKRTPIKETYTIQRENYEDQEDYEDFIDEDELEDEIIREMMEDEDRESILSWKKYGDRKHRKEGSRGKRR